METVRLTMAQALVRFLARQYLEDETGTHRFVRGVVGIFGHGNVNGLGQALEESGELEFVQGHNEQGMVHMATAYAKQMGRRQIWACTTSIGPGAMNLVTGAATATVNRIPVLLLPGDIFASRRPDPVLQQLEDPTSRAVSVNDALKPVSRYWDRILRPEQLMTAALTAMQVLTDPASCGAVTLALPQDVQSEAYDYPESFFRTRVHRLERRPPDPDALAEAARVLGEARHPLMVVGGGVAYSRAAGAVDRLARSFAIPFVETQAGKGSLPFDHPWNVGAMGVTGTAPGNRLAREADVLLGLGTRWSDFTTASKTAIGPEVRVVNLNVSPLDAAKLDGVPVVADLRVALEGLASLLDAQGYRSGHDPAAIAAVQEEWRQEVDRWYRAEATGGLAQTRVLGELNALFGPETVIVNAAGSLPGDLHRLWRCRGDGSYHMEYGFSCMGYEVAGALGVKLAQPDREVVALVGDGSFLLLHSELYTSLQQEAKILVVVFNNGAFQSIHNLQRDHGSAGFGNRFLKRAADGRIEGDPLPVDFAAYAEALGAVGLRAATVEELRRAVAEARRAERSAVIDVRVVPGTETRGYDSWWHVPVAQVARDPVYADLYRFQQERLEGARPY